MKRRALNSLLFGGAVTAATPAWPQASPRRPLVGVLLTDGANAMSTFTLPAFLQGLQELGYVDGKSITLEIRSTSGKPQALPGLGAELVVMEISSADDFEAALAAGLQAGMRAMMQLSSPLVSTLSRQSAVFAARQRLPGISAFRRYAVEGGLLSYGPVRVEMYRNAATFVAKILKGARPSELAIEQPTRFEFVINLTTARALGLNVSNALLLRADEVIQ